MDLPTYLTPYLYHSGGEAGNQDRKREECLIDWAFLPRCKRMCYMLLPKNPDCCD
jgi:hypothetical protein